MRQAQFTALGATSQRRHGKAVICPALVTPGFGRFSLRYTHFCKLLFPIRPHETGLACRRKRLFLGLRLFYQPEPGKGRPGTPRFTPARLFIEVCAAPGAYPPAIFAAKNLDRQSQKNLFGNQPVHFNHFTVKKFIEQFIRVEFFFLVPVHLRFGDKIDIDLFVQGKSEGLEATVAADLQRPFYASRNPDMVRVFVHPEKDIDRPEQFDLERVIRRNEPAQHLLVPVKGEATS